MNIHVLNAIHPYLRMLTSFDLDNFRGKRSASVLQHIGWAILTATLAVWVPIVILLGCWQLSDDNLSISQFSAAFPILISYTQTLIMFIMLSLKSREIRRQLRRLQRVIGQSKSGKGVWSVFELENDFQLMQTFLYYALILSRFYIS